MTPTSSSPVPIPCIAAIRIGAGVQAALFVALALIGGGVVGVGLLFAFADGTGDGVLVLVLALAAVVVLLPAACAAGLIAASVLTRGHRRPALVALLIVELVSSGLLLMPRLHGLAFALTCSSSVAVLDLASAVPTTVAIVVELMRRATVAGERTTSPIRPPALVEHHRPSHR